MSGQGENNWMHLFNLIQAQMVVKFWDWQGHSIKLVYKCRNFNFEIKNAV